MMGEPKGYLGRPLPELLADLSKAGPAELPPSLGSEVELYGPALSESVTARCDHLLSTVVQDAYLPANHPEVSVPGVELESFLGGGGQGWVYSGRVAETGKVVAVKVLRSVDPKAAARAAREANLCRRVRHPNVVRVFQAEPAGPFWVVVMELVQGRLLSRETLPPGGLRSCLARLADALAALGRAKVVHRDVKPANVLLRHLDHSPVLIDFGLAIDCEEPHESAAGISGTPLFLPPEALRELRPEPSWDAYSLGITAADLLGAAFADESNMMALCTSKLAGEFDAKVRGWLGGFADPTLAAWVAGLLDAKPHRRLAALAVARGWA